MAPPDDAPPLPRLTPVEAAHLVERTTGASRAELLGEGMEGVVLALDPTRVAKVWHAADPATVERLRDLHDGLDGLGLPFATPRTHEVHEAEGRVVTVEERLTGTDLRTLVEQGRLASSAARDHVVEVLAALAAAGPLPAARDLPLLGGDRPAGDWPAALAALVHRRAGSVVAAAVPHLDDLLTALGPRLAEVDRTGGGARAVVHGDLVPTNVLLDDAGSVSAVLDWGFLTTEGDPVFDAAVAAAVFEMYAEDAASVEQDLLDRVERRLGHPREALLVHRAAYSLLTATAYDPTGRDGHFAWCVAALPRPDVVDALLG